MLMGVERFCVLEDIVLFIAVLNSEYFLLFLLALLELVVLAFDPLLSFKILKHSPDTLIDFRQSHILFADFPLDVLPNHDR